MPPPPFLDAQAIRSGVPVGDMLDAVEAAYRDVAAGRDLSPLRARVPMGEGNLLLMPGVREAGAGATVKLVTIVPGNPARGLPTLHALVAWIDAETGEVRALIDGETLTAMRTGAASGVSARVLARPDASVLALIGAGGQAEWQARAVIAARPIRRVLVSTRSAASREGFAERLSGIEVEVEPVASADDAVAAADIVCCATTSAVPVFSASAVRPGTHVSGVGSFRLDMVEMPPELLGAASLVAVDARSAAMAEAGEVAAAIDRGLLEESDLVEIGTVEPDWAQRRDPEAVTVFKSVGLAIQDVAAAELIAARLLPAP